MGNDFKKDIIILNLLIGLEVIHLAKRGRKVTVNSDCIQRKILI
jgi:hypothetical protein